MPSLPRLAPGRGVARPQKTVHGVVHDRAIARRTFYSSLDQNVRHGYQNTEKTKLLQHRQFLLENVLILK